MRFSASRERLVRFWPRVSRPALPVRHEGPLPENSLIRVQQVGRTPLLRFFAPSALAGHAALSDRATSRTFPLRRLATPLRISLHPHGHSPHGPLTAAFQCLRILRCLAGPGIAHLPYSRMIRRHPWGSPFAVFIPSGRLQGLSARPVPHAVQSSVLTRLFLSGDQPPKTLTWQDL